MILRSRRLVHIVSLALVVAGAVAAAPGVAHAAVAPPTRCTTPYDPAGTTGASQRTVVRSMPAIAWLRTVYGVEHELTPRRKDAFRSVALRPCALDRGAITVWTTQPAAMIRRAWRQPWIRTVDVQWVRVRIGGVTALRAMQRLSDPAVQAQLEAALGGSFTTAYDDVVGDRLHLGIDAEELPADADARAAAILCVPVHVVIEAPPSLT